MNKLPTPVYVEMYGRVATWDAQPITPGCLPFFSVDDRNEWAGLPDSELDAYPPGMVLCLTFKNSTKNGKAYA